MYWTSTFPQNILESYWFAVGELTNNYGQLHQFECGMRSSKASLLIFSKDFSNVLFDYKIHCDIIRQKY